MMSYPLRIDQENYEATSQLKTHSICLTLDPDETMEPFEEQARRVSNEYRQRTQDMDALSTELYLALFDGFASDGKELILSDLGWDVVDSLVLLSSALYSKARMQPDERNMLRELESQSKTWIDRLGTSYEAAGALERIVRVEAHPLQIRQERKLALHAYE